MSRQSRRWFFYQGRAAYVKPKYFRPISLTSFRLKTLNELFIQTASPRTNMRTLKALSTQSRPRQYYLRENLRILTSNQTRWRGQNLLPTAMLSTLGYFQRASSTVVEILKTSSGRPLPFCTPAKRVKKFVIKPNSYSTLDVHNCSMTYSLLPGHRLVACAQQEGRNDRNKGDHPVVNSLSCVRVAAHVLFRQSGSY